MPIRPIDLQTLIPKIPEVQKAKSVESDNSKINININIQKEQQQNEKNTKQVVETKKAFEAKIRREDQRKGGQGKQERKENDSGDETADGKKKEKQSKITTIDIRI
ncbi:MAG: hypothetical protein ACM3TR_11790 [Caulobacteraceae bacterium]